MSFQGFSEAFNDAFDLTKELGNKHTFLPMSEYIFPLEDHVCTCPYTELTPKEASNSFFNGELEEDFRSLRRRIASQERVTNPLPVEATQQVSVQQIWFRKTVLVLSQHKMV